MRTRRGFALPAVLAITGVVTLIFLVAITALSTLNAEAASARARVSFLQRALTAEALVLYVATTEPAGPRGIAVGGLRVSDEFAALDQDSNRSAQAASEIFLDGRSYVADIDGPLVIRLQDQAGLINLASLSDQQFSRLGELLGTPERSRRTLRARTRDYVDSNNLTEIGGAEKSAYGTDMIANRGLRRPSEWLSVLGVRGDIESRRWEAVKNSLAADPAAPFWNINTATPATYQVMLGLSERQVESAIRTRRERPLTSLSDLGGATGQIMTDDPEQLYTFPNGKIIFTIRDSRSRWTYRGRLSLTPSSFDRPFWIDQLETLEAPASAGPVLSEADEFPYAAN